jgi:DNA-binding NarL/FixJ family response regulator
MRLPQIVVYEKDGRLKLQLEALAAERRWALREARQPDTCLSHLGQGGAAVVVIKVGRDLERELGLLERTAWLYPDATVVVVGDGDRPHWVGLAWDLGAAYILLPPQPPERLPEIVAGLMGEKAEAEKR